MGMIPTDWLIGPAAVREAEEGFAEEGAPDLWLKQWQAFLSHFGPDDELWEFHALVIEDPTRERWDLAGMRAGYALIRKGVAVETILTEWD